ncbi:MAG: hypothetical protein CL823_07445 [Crocinitomicaceae bacterium]|nr:hypothetical protein [Crocinitomicaceae bacterium]|tara:strand:+ start:5079 stop:5663 length:585 start_codon:yes stop_codon:yes gene_type:complete
MTNRLFKTVVWGVGTMSYCSLLYVATNKLSVGFEEKHRVFMDWELEIPLVPWTIIVYVSFYLLIALGFLSSRTINDLKEISGQMILAATLAAVIFLVFPGELGYDRTAEVGVFASVYEALFALDGPVNMYPSLHITFSFVAAGFITSLTKKLWWQIGVWVWFIAICFSIILVHQHHLFDLVTGVLLGWGCRKII